MADQYFPLNRRAGIWLNRLAAAAAVVGSLLLGVRTIERLAPSNPPAAAEVTGDLRVVGSHMMEEPVRRWISTFSREYPQVTIHAALYGSGIAANEMAEGRADVVPLARSMEPSERAMLSRASRAPVAVRIGSLTLPETRLASDRAASGGRAACESLYIYIAPAASARTRRLALAFVAIALSRDGQAAIDDSQFIPLDAAARRNALAQVIRLARRRDWSNADGGHGFTKGEDQQCKR